MKIMLVDDDPRIRGILADRLVSALPGVSEVIACRSAEEAMDRYVTDNPDWVVMDVDLEGMDGLEATRHIVSRDCVAKVVIFSQYADPVYERAAREAGAIAYILKEHAHVLIHLLSHHTQ